MSTEPTSKKSYLYGVLALFAALLWTSSRNDYFVGLYNDDACYWLKAFYVAQSSQLEVYNEFFPALHNYAPGWPLVLAPFTFLFGEAEGPYRFLAACLALLGVFVWFELAKRRFKVVTAFLFALSLVSCGAAIKFSHTLMSEPLFFLLTAVCVWLMERPKTSTPVDLGTGLLLCFVLFTRSEGLAILLALSISLLLAKNWKRAGVIWAGCLVPYVCFSFFGQKKAVHFAQVFDSLLKRESWSAFISEWTSLQLKHFSTALLGMSNSITSAALALLTLGAFWGGYVLWKERPSILVFLPGGFVLSFLLWPFLSSRYWWVVIPLWLLLLLLAVPEKARLLLLTTLIAVQLGAHWTRPVAETTKVLQLYRACRQLEQSPQIVALFDMRVRVQGRQRAINVGQFRSSEELIAYMARTNSEYLLWETQNSLIRDVSGKTQASFPQDLLLWITRSRLFDMVESNEAGVLLKFRGEPERVALAFEAYRKAMLSQEPEVRFRELERSLALEPDFPKVRVLYIAEKLKTNGAPNEVELESYLKQYPHDYQAFLYLSPYLSKEGSGRLYEIVYAEAQRLKSAQALAALSSWLSNQH